VLHEAVTWPLAGVNVKPVGVAGTPAGVIAFEGVDAAELPKELEAATVNV
jgi:hypothetical protein